MRAKLDYIDEVAKNIKMFWFTPERKPRQIAGQFTELYLPHKNADKRGNKRWFTLTSSPTEDKLAITTKFAQEKGSTFKQTLANLKPGDDVMLAQPMGDFVLPRDKTIPLILVAGGIGVTPMRSMVKYLLDTGEKRDIELIYAANSIEEVAFRDLFEEYGLKLTLMLNNPPAGWPGVSGKLTAERIVQLVGNLNGKLVYMSGPDPMVKALAEGLYKIGASKKQIITDYFPGYHGI